MTNKSPALSIYFYQVSANSDSTKDEKVGKLCIPDLEVAICKLNVICELVLPSLDYKRL